MRVRMNKKKKLDVKEKPDSGEGRAGRGGSFDMETDTGHRMCRIQKLKL